MLALKFVYVVGNGRAVKIGKSTTPEARIASLNPGSSAPLVTYYVGATNGDGGAITGAHSLLSAFRLLGEMVRCRAGSQEAAIAAVETAVGRSAGAAVTAAERSGRQGASLSILARISSYCDRVRRRPPGIGGAAFASMRTVRCLVRQRRGDEPGVRDPVSRWIGEG
jgi:hypothetical protein